MTRRIRFSMQDDTDALWDYDVYRYLERYIDALVPLVDRRGELMGPWMTSTRRKVIRATLDGVSFTRSIHRDPDTWTVRWQTQIHSSDLNANFEASVAWRYDPKEPFPHPCYNEDMWDDIDDDYFKLSVSGCVGKFFNSVGVDRSTAYAVIAACEADQIIDAQDAMTARLALK